LLLLLFNLSADSNISPSYQIYIGIGIISVRSTNKQDQVAFLNVYNQYYVSSLKFLTFMFMIRVNHGSHSVVPQLNSTSVQTGQNPRSLWVETEAFYTLALGLEFDDHFF
jgi:hypothetical protein